MSRPCGASDELAICDGTGYLDRDEGATGEVAFGAAGGTGVELLALEASGGGENLRAVAECGDGLVGLGEVADDLEDFGVEAQILGRASAGDDEGVVILRLDA